MFDMMCRAFLVGKSKRERVLEHISTINNKHAWKLINTLEKSWDKPGGGRNLLQTYHRAVYDLFPEKIERRRMIAFGQLR